MFGSKLVHVLVLLNLALFAWSASVGLSLEPVSAAGDVENSDLVRDKREAEPRRGHLLNLLGNKYNSNYNYRPTSGYQEVHYSGGSGNTATFAQSSAGAISTNNGHGHGGVGSQSSSQSSSYSFGPFSASFSVSQSNANGGGSFFDY